MLLTWNVIDRTGRRIGRVRARGYGRAHVLAAELFGDRAHVLIRQRGGAVFSMAG